MKIHDDLSNDDLIDLLIKKGFRPDRRKERNCPTENSGALAVDAEVKQDASMGEGGVASADLQASERPALRQYHPLELVWHGEDDAELIEQLLAFYPHTEPRLILDFTVNGRRFWRGSSRPVIGVDIDKRHRPDVCADHTSMPFHSSLFDVVVYDPPTFRTREMTAQRTLIFVLASAHALPRKMVIVSRILIRRSWPRHGESWPKMEFCSARSQIISTITVINGRTLI